MTTPEIEKLLLEAIAPLTNESVTANATPAKLGLDSLDQVDICMALEETLDRDIPDVWLEDVEGLENKTIHELAEMLAKKLEAA